MLVIGLEAHVHQTCRKSMGAIVGMGSLGHLLPRSAIFLLQSSPQRSMAMDIGFLRHLSLGRGIAMGVGFLGV